MSGESLWLLKEFRTAEELSGFLPTPHKSMRGMALIALAVLATSMIVEDATAVDSSEQKDLTQLLSSDQACHQKGFGSRQHAFAKCPISLLGEVSGQHRLFQA